LSGVFKPCTAILPPAQQRLWRDLRPARDLGLVLYGGTAIALRLGHRASVDFDFFSDRPLDRAAIAAALPFVTLSTVLQDARDSLTVIVPVRLSSGDAENATVKVSFFGNIGFGRAGEPNITDDGVLCVASLEDLMATKVKTFPQRAEAKDYRDIAAMVHSGVSLAKGLAAARLFFGTTFQPSESLKALVYFSDGDLGALTQDEKSVLVKAVSAVRELPAVEIVSERLMISGAARA
jgi:hypothetical protein